MWLIVGLGNPGEKYAQTRHNVGFMVVDAMTQKEGGSFQKGFKADFLKTQIKEAPVLFLKPQTFMNLSGESVQAAAQFHKIPKENIIVIHDELDISFGEIRVKFDGGHGGHNGVRDIIRTMGPGFTRIRVGVGRPSIKGLEAEFVLKNYRKDELQELPFQIQTASDAIISIIQDGLKKAQMLFNQKQSALAKKE